MKSFILLVALTITSSFVMAEGGQKQGAPSPVYSSTGDTVGTVIPVPEGCEVIVPQSGKNVYVMCPDD